jgi:hypothetical protein
VFGEVKYNDEVDTIEDVVGFRGGIEGIREIMIATATCSEDRRKARILRSSRERVWPLLQGHQRYRNIYVNNGHAGMLAEEGELA